MEGGLGPRIRRASAVAAALPLVWVLVWVLVTANLTGVQAAASSVPAMGCDAPARSYDAIAALLAESGLATPAATTGGQTLPEGVTAGTTSAAAMERVVRLWLACQNAGEPLRAWSLLSDGYLYRLLSRQEVISADAYREMATPTIATAESSTLVEIEGHRILPDGRYGATVVIAYPSVPTPKRFFFYFTEVDGRLVIDGILGEISFSVP
jgi:hypothetical protein